MLGIKIFKSNAITGMVAFPICNDMSGLKKHPSTNHLFYTSSLLYESDDEMDMHLNRTDFDKAKDYAVSNVLSLRNLGL